MNDINICNQREQSTKVFHDNVNEIEINSIDKIWKKFKDQKLENNINIHKASLHQIKRRYEIFHDKKFKD